MYQFPIGVMLESFRLPFREAVEKAASLGVSGLQIYMTQPGEILTEQNAKCCWTSSSPTG